MSAQTPNPKRYPQRDGKSLLDQSLDFGPEDAVLPPTEIKRLESILKQIEEISARIDKIASER
jgi:hypothetical protein